MLNIWDFDWNEIMLFHFIISITKQSSDSFEELADNLQLSLEKISNKKRFLTVALRGFDSKLVQAQ